MNIIFVKWGHKYAPADVNTLYHSLQYSNCTFYCLTEDPTGLDSNINIIPIPETPRLKTWWNKLYMFSKDFPLSGKCMYFDLDTYIRKNPFNVELDWSALTMVDCSFKTHIPLDKKHHYDVFVNSQVLAWDADNEYVHGIWDKFISNKDYYLRKYKGIDRFIVHEKFDHKRFPKEFTQSYKYEQEENDRPIVTFEELDYGREDIKRWIERDRANL